MLQKKYLRTNGERWGTQNFYIAYLLWKGMKTCGATNFWRRQCYYILILYPSCTMCFLSELPVLNTWIIVYHVTPFVSILPREYLSLEHLPLYIFLSSMLYRLSFLCSSTHSSTAVLNDIIWWRYFQDVDDKELIYTYATKC